MKSLAFDGPIPYTSVKANNGSSFAFSIYDNFPVVSISFNFLIIFSPKYGFPTSCL